MLQSAYLTAFGCEIEKLAAKILLDDSIPNLDTSSPHCAKIAALSKTEAHCRKLYDILQNIICRPGEYSPKSVLKGLELVSYLLVHGGEFCVEYTFTELQLQIEFMQEYNSAVILNEQNILYRIKGGSSDEGEPVREIAEELTTLLKSNTQQTLLKMRDLNLLKSTTQNSNGPSHLQTSNNDLLIGFGGIDPGRSAAPLKKQNKMTSGGFGSGLGGKKKGEQVVVGAQFTLEDMLADQRNRPSKYYDDEQKMKRLAEETNGMMDLLRETSNSHAINATDVASMSKDSNDLLDFNHAEPTYDNFGSTDLLQTNESISTHKNTAQHSNSGSKPSDNAANDLLNMFTTSDTISSANVSMAFAPAPSAPPPPPPGPPPPCPPLQPTSYSDPFDGL